MDIWIFCGDDFIVADVIRWVEAVWEKRGPKQGRAVAIGDRMGTAEVIHEDEDGGYVTLLIRESRVMSDKSGRGKVQPLKVGERIRRKRATLKKGRPERMLWSEESVRDELTRRPGRQRARRMDQEGAAE